MKISYKTNQVRKYCEEFREAQKFFGNINVAKKLAVLMKELESFNHILDFTKVAKLQKYELHDLLGDKKGIKALKIDYSYRMELEVIFYATENDDEDSILILEVNKHYGK